MSRPRGRVAGRSLRILLGLVLLGLAVLGPARAASAHAELETTDPADSEVVATAPKAITMTFSEGVTVQGDGVRVLDTDARRVDAGRAKADGQTVTVPLEGTLADGGYVVAWRAISADGHPVRGAFQFFVGKRTIVREGLVEEAFAGNADRRDEVVGAVLRGLQYLMVFGVAGLVWVGAALRRPDEPPPVGRLAGSATAVALLVALAQLPVQASLATGRGWGSISESGVLDLALADGVGWALAVTGLGLLCLLVTTGLPFNGPVRVFALLGAALAPLGLVLTGHTRSMSPAVLAYLADGAHVVAGSVWFGGLLALLVAVRRRRRAGDAAGAVEAVARYSGWAGLALAAVAVSGIALAWIEVRGLHALTSTTYGRLLVVKVWLVGMVALAAAWNRFRLVPALLGDGAGALVPNDGAEADAMTPDEAVAVDEVGADEVGSDEAVDPAEAAEAVEEVEAVEAVGPERVEVPGVDPGPILARLRKVVRIEVVGIALVLALTAVLANTTPARSVEGGGVVSVRAKLGDGSVEVLVDPAKTGRNDIHAYLLTADGGVDGRYDAATFQLALPAEDIGPLERTPVVAAPGHFQLVGTDLAPAGEWQLTITVKPDRFTEESATVSFRVR